MSASATAADLEQSIVYVIDDDPSVRAALEDLLSSVGLEARSFGSAAEFQRAEHPDTPSCLVLDVRMPGVSGLDFQQDLMRKGEPRPIVFITAHGDVEMCARAMKAGAVDFLMKPFRDQDLLDAIQAALQKDQARRRETATADEVRRRYQGLNAGERDVLALVVAGRLNKQIAADLGLSEITVKVRRGQLMRKMGASSLADLVKMAAHLAEVE